MRKKKNTHIVDVVTKQPISQELKNGYYITIRFMYGDADGYAFREMGPFSKDEKHLLFDAIETIERCVYAYPRGKGGDDGYEHIPGWAKWFGDEDYYDDEDWGDYEDEDEEEDCEEEKESLCQPPQAIPMEYTHDGWHSPATFKDYEVKYYENGQPYECNVVWEDVK